MAPFADGAGVEPTEPFGPTEYQSAALTVLPTIVHLLTKVMLLILTEEKSESTTFCFFSASGLRSCRVSTVTTLAVLEAVFL